MSNLQTTQDAKCDSCGTTNSVPQSQLIPRIAIHTGITLVEGNLVSCNGTFVPVQE